MTEEDEFHMLVGEPKRGIDWFKLGIWLFVVLFCAAMLGAAFLPLIAMVMS
jgi:hypothetical protein